MGEVRRLLRLEAQVRQGLREESVARTEREQAAAGLGGAQAGQAGGGGAGVLEEPGQERDGSAERKEAEPSQLELAPEGHLTQPGGELLPPHQLAEGEAVQSAGCDAGHGGPGS